jgi:hypothetical protein
VSYAGKIELTEGEQELLAKINLEPDPHDRDTYEANKAAVPELMASLIKRNAIPNHRVQYFTNPDYHFGSTKGAYKDVFERNGTKGREIFEHPHFLKFLRYFLFGASLPEDAIREFAERVRGLEPITSDDVQDLWDLAKDLSNKYRLEPVNFADEFFKLALDCALPLMHARHIRRVVRKMRLRK